MFENRINLMCEAVEDCIMKYYALRYKNASRMNIAVSEELPRKSLRRDFNSFAGVRRITRVYRGLDKKNERNAKERVVTAKKGRAERKR